MTTKMNRPVQIFRSHAVVLLSFISRFALVRHQIDTITTGLQKKSGREDRKRRKLKLKHIFCAPDTALDVLGMGTRYNCASYSAS